MENQRRTGKRYFREQISNLQKTINVLKGEKEDIREVLQKQRETNMELKRQIGVLQDGIRKTSNSSRCRK